MKSWSEAERSQWWASLTSQERIDLAWSWQFYARPQQLAPPGDWSQWLTCAGRGYGKTRQAAEWCNEQATLMPGSRGFCAGRTAADVRDVMVTGKSGLVACSHPLRIARYISSQRLVVWPNGSQCLLFSAEVPDQPRGPEHHWGWCDELGAWGQYGYEFWDNLILGLRLEMDGQRPRVVITTTPRNTRLMRDLYSDPDTVVTHGSTYDNTENLPQSFIKKILRKYEGTRLGDQELQGILLTDTPGALFKREWYEKPGFRLGVELVPELPACVVGVDPSASSGEEAAHTGIITVGRGTDGRYYTLRDDSKRGTPREWGAAVCHAYHESKADYVVAEANNGGEMVSYVIQSIDPAVPVKLVHAARGKQTRAEPISSLYEQGRCSHVGTFKELEDEQQTWVPGEASPDRMDASVWAHHHLMVDGEYIEVDPGVVLRSSPARRA